MPCSCSDSFCGRLVAVAKKEKNRLIVGVDDAADIRFSMNKKRLVGGGGALVEISDVNESLGILTIVLTASNAAIRIRSYHHESCRCVWYRCRVAYSSWYL